MQNKKEINELYKQEKSKFMVTRTLAAVFATVQVLVTYAPWYQVLFSSIKTLLIVTYVLITYSNTNILPQYISIFSSINSWKFSHSSPIFVSSVSRVFYARVVVMILIVTSGQLLDMPEFYHFDVSVVLFADQF